MWLFKCHSPKPWKSPENSDVSSPFSAFWNSPAMFQRYSSAIQFNHAAYPFEGTPEGDIMPIITAIIIATAAPGASPLCQIAILSFVKGAGNSDRHGSGRDQSSSRRISNTASLAVMESQISALSKRLEAAEIAVRWKTELSDARR